VLGGGFWSVSKAMTPSSRCRRASRWCQVLCIIGVVLALTPQTFVAAAEGHLVLVGGGPTPAQVFSRALALSGVALPS